jgi:hypothetical protein
MKLLFMALTALVLNISCSKSEGPIGSTEGSSQTPGGGNPPTPPPAPTATPSAFAALKLHPDNKRYFLDQNTNKPVLVLALEDSS